MVNPEVDPAWHFMTLDWDGKIRMDCSSPNAMASLRSTMTPDAEGRTPYDVATGTTPTPTATASSPPTAG